MCVLLGRILRNLNTQRDHFIHHYLLTGTIWIMTHFTLDSGIMAQMMRDNTRPLKENFISTLNILMGLDRAGTGELAVEVVVDVGGAGVSVASAHQSRR